MKNNFLAVITDKNFGGKLPPINWHPRRKRETARAVIIDNFGRVAVIFASKYNYHKLPGGGIEKGENIKQTLKRECVEEVGQPVKIIVKIGRIKECKLKLSTLQISNCFIAKAIGRKVKINLMANEKSHKFKVLWLPIEKALKKFAADRPKIYEGHFMSKRDFIFLKSAKKLIKKYERVQTIRARRQSRN